MGAPVIRLVSYPLALSIMNHAFAFATIVLLALGASACQQEAVAPEGGTGLVGEWHWVISQGGLTGHQTATPASTGTTQTWVFRADSTYQAFTTQQGSPQLTDSGTFSLGLAPSIYTGSSSRALRLHGQRERLYIVQELSSTRLQLADNYPDGFGHTYER